MSEPLRIALVAEGPTDRYVIQAAIENLLGDRAFVFRQLQPEESIPFNQLTGGWGGVYHWCAQAAKRAGGALRNDPLFATFDILVLHLDVDVARKTYADAGIGDSIGDLPCEMPCPPHDDTTQRLRTVVLRWIGESVVPPKTVFCMPSKSIEAWVLAALYPADLTVMSGGLECYQTPHLQLQAKPLKGRLVTHGRKLRDAYRQRAPEIAEAWPDVRTRCEQAHRFSTEFELIALHL